MIDIELAGIPAHAWSKDTTQQLLGSSYWVRDISPDTAAMKDLRSFRLSALSLRRDLVPEAVDMFIPEPLDVAVPPKQGLVYPVECSPARSSPECSPVVEPYEPEAKSQTDAIATELAAALASLSTDTCQSQACDNTHATASEALELPDQLVVAMAGLSTGSQSPQVDGSVQNVDPEASSQVESPSQTVVDIVSAPSLSTPPPDRLQSRVTLAVRVYSRRCRSLASDGAATTMELASLQGLTTPQAQFMNRIKQAVGTILPVPKMSKRRHKGMSLGHTPDEAGELRGLQLKQSRLPQPSQGRQ
ncbi:hypothetical protein PR202_gb25891 [Eleusine coracana subsp. coracana]|uniref:Uncharacterized protein n=1 Tax=Eleusine coracana subsp. coracana TaxID=191504 RepID=A0AAV5FQF7_ELECO|nr:hypothetical protein PR202_gb25891 [Eleusine coracana subsp. coracana]